MDFELLDIEFLGFFIILNRFIYFLFNYNLITALYIVFISAGSCIIWFKFFVLNSKFFFKFNKNPGRALITQRLNIFDNKMDRLVRSIIRIFFKKKKKRLRFLNSLWEDIRTLLFYFIVLRQGKAYLPFFIRWNWSLVILLKFAVKITCSFYRRAYFLKFKVLKFKRLDDDDRDFDLLPVILDSPIDFPTEPEESIDIEQEINDFETIPQNNYNTFQDESVSLKKNNMKFIQDFHDSRKDYDKVIENEEFLTDLTLFVLIFVNLFIAFYGFINSALGQFTIIPFLPQETSSLPKNILCETNKTILKLLKIENI
uniref:Uncharacterized protein n=1 Tax=Nitzschia putrida TaxID=2742595 RepID=A0A7R7TQV7_9STRA|nr:hypothetical protein Ycf90 [Nitzschia putrida]